MRRLKPSSTFGPTFRDQFTPAEEEAMEAAQAWSEENEEECPWCGGTGEGDFVPGASVKPPCGQCCGRGLIPRKGSEARA